MAQNLYKAHPAIIFFSSLVLGTRSYRLDLLGEGSMYKALPHSVAIYARAGEISPAIDKIFISCVLSEYRQNLSLSLAPSSYLSFHLSASPACETGHA